MDMNEEGNGEDNPVFVDDHGNKATPGATGRREGGGGGGRQVGADQSVQQRVGEQQQRAAVVSNNLGAGGESKSEQRRSGKSSASRKLSKKLSDSFAGGVAAVADPSAGRMFGRKNQQGEFFPLPLDESQPIVDYKKSSSNVDVAAMNSDASAMSPSRRVEFILGRKNLGESRDVIDVDTEVEYATPKLFTELEELQEHGEEGETVWKETARWVKFEETVEDGGDRWSKPHVATLSLQSLFDLRQFLSTSSIQLNWIVDDFSDLIDRVLDLFVQEGNLPNDLEIRGRVRAALMSNHEHQGERRNKSSRASFRDSKKLSSFFKEKTFMRKIPEGAEASNILIGEQQDLKKPLIAFIRLKEAIAFDGITEVPVPTRFLFILLGPRGKKQQYHEVGRSIATLMADEVFHEVAYKAKTREDLLTGIDEFLQQVTVLPPGEWDKRIRIEPPQSIPADQKKRLKEEPFSFDNKEEDLGHSAPGLELRRTGRLFGGLMADIRRKAPFYKSDFTDALNIQCVASFIFLYFAVLTPIVTFGGLLDDATHSYLGTMESLLGGCMAGVAFHLFSGQPLTIIGSTGPILVFEKIMNELCASLDINYISFRFWVGAWTGLACILLVAFDASSLICYVTRYTEESFSALISLIFIFEAFKKLFSEADKHKVWLGWESEKTTLYQCSCQPPDISLLPINDATNPNFTDANLIELTEQSRNKTNADIGNIFRFGNDSFTCVFKDNIQKNLSAANWPMNLTKKECVSNYCGDLVGESCEYAPDIFFMSVILFFGTYSIAVFLKSLKTSRFFTNTVRSLISDFAVTIAIALMVVVDLFLGFETSKLQVPATFKPTRDDRGWFISPLGGNEWWTIPLAIIPALLATILIFMDQQITAVIVNRKENKLKKGCGYHLDLLVVAVMLIVCSVMGLPWFVAATVLSITHVNSLKQESETAAPGDKPKFLGVREQRLTGTLIFLMIGVSVFLTPVLALIPMPILYGVFLYMGTSSLNGVQFFERMLLFFMPPKHQPDYSFLRHVPLRRVHLFTFLQFLGLVALWVIKSVKPVSIVFPIMVAALVGIRKLFDYGVFSQHDLKWLDDVMPESSRPKKKKKKKKAMESDDSLHDDDSADCDVKINGPPPTDESIRLKIDDDDDNETAM